ncbi:MAG TPA: tetratricopeptide repeat protein [candidate division WOR-3 bacterium]|uniref:Tetratricopeptide repeat protein n=1 Tax=candidate division WOR-3 bacterium TaxID=2052148 RepID=A0A9C9K0P9_UNCW3|nr:tetratricopeptide repeat protein [candidate division WOR-3 bacterium]
MRRIKRGHYKEDEFQSTMHNVVKYIMRHRDVSITVGAILIIGIIALSYFLSRGEPQIPEADILHTQAIGLLNMGRFQDAEKVLIDLSTKYQNTRPGKIGLYYLGVLYYNSAKFDQAIDYFDRFLSKEKKDYLLTPAALFGAGCAAEGMKDYKKALRYYERIIKDKNSPFYDVAMLACGRLNGLLGNKEKARKILSELLEKNPTASIAGDARFYIGLFNQ